MKFSEEDKSKVKDCIQQFTTDGSEDAKNIPADKKQVSVQQHSHSLTKWSML